MVVLVGEEAVRAELHVSRRRYKAVYVAALHCNTTRADVYKVEHCKDFRGSFRALCLYIFKILSMILTPSSYGQSRSSREGLCKLRGVEGQTLLVSHVRYQPKDIVTSITASALRSMRVSVKRARLNQTRIIRY